MAIFNNKDTKKDNKNVQNDTFGDVQSFAAQHTADGTEQDGAFQSLVQFGENLQTGSQSLASQTTTGLLNLQKATEEADNRTADVSENRFAKKDETQAIKSSTDQFGKSFAANRESLRQASDTYFETAGQLLSNSDTLEIIGKEKWDDLDGTRRQKMKQMDNALEDLRASNEMDIFFKDGINTWKAEDGEWSETGENKIDQFTPEEYDKAATRYERGFWGNLAVDTGSLTYKIPAAIIQGAYEETIGLGVNIVKAISGEKGLWGEILFNSAMLGIDLATFGSSATARKATSAMIKASGESSVKAAAEHTVGKAFKDISEKALKETAEDIAGDTVTSSIAKELENAVIPDDILKNQARLQDDLLNIDQSITDLNTEKLHLDPADLKNSDIIDDIDSQISNLQLNRGDLASELDNINNQIPDTIDFNKLNNIADSITKEAQTAFREAMDIADNKIDDIVKNTNVDRRTFNSTRKTALTTEITEEAMKDTMGSLDNLDSIVKSLESNIDSLSDEAKSVVKNMRTTIDDARTTIRTEIYDSVRSTIGVEAEDIIKGSSERVAGKLDKFKEREERLQDKGVFGKTVNKFNPLSNTYLTETAEGVRGQTYSKLWSKDADGKRHLFGKTSRVLYRAGIMNSVSEVFAEPAVDAIITGDDPGGILETYVDGVYQGLLGNNILGNNIQYVDEDGENRDSLISFGNSDDNTEGNTEDDVFVLPDWLE